MRRREFYQHLGIVEGMGKTILAVTALTLALGGCATANTPQQELAYARWARCERPYTQLAGVGVDGRITFQVSSSSARQEVAQCLADAGRGGPLLPEPVAVGPPGGP
jgi:hypothetical protein